MISPDILNITSLIATLTYFVFATLLALYDYRMGILPDKLTLSLLWMGLLFHSIFHSSSLSNAVYGAVSGYLSLWLLYWIFFMFTKKEGMGYGDFKLLAAIGAWNGWQSLALILVIASLTGMMAFFIVRIIQRKSITQLPFGPSLAIAGWGEFFWQVSN